MKPSTRMCMMGGNFVANSSSGGGGGGGGGVGDELISQTHNHFGMQLKF